MTATFPSDSSNTPRSSFYYHHSGKAPLSVVLLALLIGAIVSVPAAAIYSLGVVYIPFLKLRWLLAFGLGAALGLIPAKIMHVGKVRSNFMSIAVTLIAATIGLYFAWVAWFVVLLHRADISVDVWVFASHPARVWRLIQRVNDEGTWRMGDSSQSNVSGIFLWIIWAGEAIVIYFSAIFIASKLINEQPFCETCQKWCGKPRRLGYAARGNAGELRTRLEAGNFSGVGPLGTAVPSPAGWLEFSHHTCPTCGQLNTLTVKSVTVTRKKKGKDTKSVKTVIKHLLMHPGEAEGLLPQPKVEATTDAKIEKPTEIDPPAS